MRVYVLWSIVVFLFAYKAMAITLSEKGQHSKVRRHDTTGITCHDPNGNEGICKDEREKNIGNGDFFRSKLCKDRCNPHLKCFVPTPVPDCDEKGGKCLEPSKRCDGESEPADCKDGYQCCIERTDENCMAPGKCQPDVFEIKCRGDTNTNLCGDGFKCCTPYTDDNDDECTATGGICKDTNEPCVGIWTPSLCVGYHERKCCVPHAEDKECTDYGGICQNARACPCDGDYVFNPDLCKSGGPEIQCCVPGCIDHHDESSECHYKNGCCRPVQCHPRETAIDAECPQRDLTDILPAVVIPYDCECCVPPKTGNPNVGLDPIFNTLDHKRYRFDGHCSYVLMRECTDPLGTSRFTIINKHGLMEGLRSKLGAYIKDIYIYFNGLSAGNYRIDLLEGKLVSINNGAAMHIDDLSRWEDVVNGIIIEHDGPYVKVDKHGEFTVWFSGTGRVNVAIDNQYRGKVCGLLGNGNDDPDDDLMKLTPTGLDLTDDVDEFGESWVVKDSCPM